MKYFNTFPKVITTDYNNNLILLTNIMNRVEIVPSLLQNPLIFYSYDIKESDTPEIIADKYYGDSYRYWMVLLANQIIDPQWDWPLTSRQFSDFLTNKYSVAANGTNILSYTQSTIYGYTKTIVTTDSLSSTSTTINVNIDLSTYTLTQVGTMSQTFPSGSTVTQTISKAPVSIYDYENGLNESKRNINLINSSYATDFEKQLTSLLGR